MEQTLTKDLSRFLIETIKKNIVGKTSDIGGKMKKRTVLCTVRSVAMILIRV